MKKYPSLVSIMMFAATLSGCGEQQSTGTQPSDAASTSGAAATNTASAPVTGSGGIDHTRDIMEFELKRSLSGVESLIEELKAKGADISEELEAKKKDLEQKLAAFKSG